MGLGTQSPGSGVVIRGSVGESEGLVPWVLEAGTLRHVFLASQVSGLLRGWGLGKWPKCWSFSFSISPSSEYFRTDFL